MTTVTLTITTSTYPGFDLFADVRFDGRQVSRRGNRAEIDTFTAELTEAAKLTGRTLTITDETR